MRQIKFRIWHKRKACFISDEVAIYYDGVIDWLNQDRPVLDNNDVVIQQYTGLKDKNGVEIYEGDLADWCEDSYVNEHTKPATIVWHEEEGWQCIWYKEDGSESFRDPLYVYVNQHNFKVIGNIFDKY